ncbi:MAG: signal recognition particle protein, partial [Flavobacteriales bacterium]|nr:signal recognition particle protein [Flavobacteriales bacterium]
QIQQIKKMGNIKDLASMIPGMGKAMKNMDIPDDAFKQVEAIIRSMTPQERKQPDLLNGSRKKRIAVGAGVEVQDVNKLIKQFLDTRKMMRMMSDKSAMSRMMGGMKGMPQSIKPA